jgi:polar amino acid transport system substrate-binding protein
MMPIGTLSAENYKASLAEMPLHAVSNTEGIQVDLVKAIAKVSGNIISIEVCPFARSINNVVTGKADFHIPLIKNDVIPEAKLPYAYSTETLFHTNFVLYTLKGSPVNTTNLASYKVETDRAHVEYFPFKISPSNTIEQSLNKLKIGRIDAFIFADSPSDAELKKLGFKNIQRRLYKRFDVKAVLPRNEHGKQVDAMLTKAIEDLRKNGTLHKIEGATDAPYNDWQP